MSLILRFSLIAIFSIFLGSQITEGFLLLPYWKTLHATEFYATFGPIIGSFYTILTIIAALIPMSISSYCFLNKSDALKYSLASTFFVLIVIAIFYIYFKGANQLFYEAALNADTLASVLRTWGNWHWVRVLFEILSLFFLILSLSILGQEQDLTTPV